MSETVFDKEALLEALSYVQPSLLSSQLFLPELSNFCFTAEHVYAFNDKTALVHPIEDTGILQGLSVPAVLLPLLVKAKAKTVQVSREEEGTSVLKFSSGRTKLKLACTPTSGLFTVPEKSMKKDSKITLTEDLLSSLTLCASLCTGSMLRVIASGVTCKFENKSVRLFSTDDFTVTHATVKTDTSGVQTSRAVLLPKQFISLLEKNKEEVVDKDLVITKDCRSAYVMTEGRQIIYTLLSGEDMTKTFGTVLEKYTVHEDSEVRVTDKLRDAVSDAQTFLSTESEKERKSVRVKLDEDSFTILATATCGEFRRKVVAEGTGAELDFTYNADMLSRGFGSFDTFSTTSVAGVLCLQKNGATHLIPPKTV